MEWAPSFIFELREEAQKRGEISPDIDTLEKLTKYSRMIRNGKAKVKFVFHGLPVGTCERGRFRWDYKMINNIMNSGTPTEFFQPFASSLASSRIDINGKKSKRVDYPWSKASKKPLYLHERDANEHVDGISNFASVDEVLWVLICASFFWDGHCSFSVYDITETL
jgi:hypothetical protein